MRQDIRRAQVAAELLGHDVVPLGEKAALQGALDLQHPGVMKIVEGAITDPRPIMHWYDIASFSRGGKEDTPELASKTIRNVLNGINLRRKSL